MAHTLGDVALVNQALAHIGWSAQLADVAALDTGNTVEAKNARLFLDDELDQALASYRWKWAEKRAVLTELTGTGAWWDDLHQVWEHVYALPTDCVIPRRLWDGSRFPAPTELQTAFDFMFDAAGTARVLATDEDPVTTGTDKRPLLLYTARIADAALYPVPFKNHLAWRLAMALAVPIWKDKALPWSQKAAAGVVASFRDAWVFDRSVWQPDPKPPTPSIAARGARRPLTRTR